MGIKTAQGSSQWAARGNTLIIIVGAAGLALSLLPALAAPAGPPAARTGQASPTGVVRTAEPVPADSNAEHLRPANGDFQGGANFDSTWHFRGTRARQGQIVSKDVTFNMDLLDWDAQTHIGVATGSPRVVDTHNVITAVKMTILDAGSQDVRKVILEGHVKIIHHPDEDKNNKPSGDDLSDVLSHDVVLTCDHAEYYYRAKRSIATGNPRLEGQDKPKDKLVPVTLTADRLESEDRQNTYRAIGNVVVTEPDRNITSPLMTAIVEDRGGDRKVRTITLAPPVRFTGLINDSDEGSTGATTGTSTTGTSTTGTPATGTPTTGTPVPASASPTLPPVPVAATAAPGSTGEAAVVPPKVVPH